MNRISKFLASSKTAVVVFLLSLCIISASSTYAQWSELGGTNSSTFNYHISTLTTDAGGNLYAAGLFENNYGKYYVAKWNGSSWSEVGGTNSSTFNSAISVLTAAGTSSNLYAGGSFMNGVETRYVAKWNGSSWSELGGTNSIIFNSDVNTLTADKMGNLYAGGDFRNGNGNRYVAKWNGSSWSELGGTNSSTIDYYINTLTTDASGNVYAGGAFSNGKREPYVAKWNGSSWSELGGTNSSMFNSSILTLSTDASGNLYAAGNFKNSNGNQYVAKWDGSSWSEVGGRNSSTFNSWIYTLTTDASGNLYAGGWFKNGNGKQYVAKWNGSSWSELGGTNSSTFNGFYGIITLTTDAGGNVYAGGGFTNSKGMYYVAKYTNTTVPVKLVNFTAQANTNSTAQLTWQTATETNSSHFVVERGGDGTHFSALAQVAAVGNSTKTQQYHYTDIQPLTGINYYRLKMVDKDGSVTYSKIVSLTFTSKQYPVSIFPNPAKDKVVVQFAPATGKGTVVILSTAGKEVSKTVINVQSGKATLPINHLPKGVYTLQLITNHATQVQKLVVE